MVHFGVSGWTVQLDSLRGPKRKSPQFRRLSRVTWAVRQFTCLTNVAFGNIGIGREPTFHPKQRLQVYPRLFELQERRNANVVDAGAFVRQPKHLAVSACHLIIPLGLGRFD